MIKTELTPTQKLFRSAMASMTSAVNVITTNGAAGRCGITATAVCSITDTPPTIMVCINRSSAMNIIFKENNCLCVNILSAEHIEVAKHFAGMTCIEMSQRFTLNDWQEELYNLPILKGALANLQGKISNVSEVGTHTIFFVEIETINVEEGNGLAYFNRNFHPVVSSAQ